MSNYQITLEGDINNQAKTIVEFIYSWYTSSGIRYTKGVEYTNKLYEFTNIFITMDNSVQKLLNIIKNDDFLIKYLNAIDNDDKFEEYCGYIPHFLNDVCPILDSIHLDGQEDLMNILQPTIKQFLKNYC